MEFYFSFRQVENIHFKHYIFKILCPCYAYGHGPLFPRAKEKVDHKYEYDMGAQNSLN